MEDLEKVHSRRENGKPEGLEVTGKVLSFGGNKQTKKMMCLQHRERGRRGLKIRNVGGLSREDGKRCFTHGKEGRL